MFVLLALLYPLAVQYEARKWYWLAPLSLFTLLLDVVSNYTDLAFITWDFPRKGEWTFSQRLARLQHGNPWQRFVAKVVIPYLNFFHPGHIREKDS